MTERADLLALIAGAIARKGSFHAPEEVLTVLERDHLLVERGRWERLLAFAAWAFEEDFHDCDEWRNWENAKLKPGDLDDAVRESEPVAGGERAE